MGTARTTPTKKAKPLSTYDNDDPRKWALAAWRLSRGTVRATAAGHLHWRTRGDLATPAAGAASLYLLSTVGVDPLGPLGPTLLESGLLDVTDPWRLMVAATGGAAALMFQRSDGAHARRERRAVQRAFAKLGIEEPPSKLYPKGRPIQVGMPEATLAGSKLVMPIPDGLSENNMLQLAAVLSPMLKGRVSIRPVPPPPSARKAATAKIGLTASKTVASARRTVTGEDTAPKAVAKAKSPVEQLLSGGHVEFNIRRREALTAPVPWLHLKEIRQPGYRGRSVVDPWHVGNDEDGSPVMQTIFQKNKLYGGEAGSGKTTGEHVDIGAVVQDPKSRNFFIDPSGGAEFGFWEPVAEGGRAGCAYTAEEALKLLIRLHQEGVNALKRMSEMADAREAAGLPRTNVTRGEVTTWIWIDELLNLTKHPDRKIQDQFAFLLFDIIGRLRKVGYHVVASTLKPSGDVIPTFIRDLISLKQVFRCTTAEASTAVLGDKVWAALGFGGHKIEIQAPQGISYLLATESYPVRLRSAFINPDRLPGQKFSERAEVLNAALRLRGLPEQTFAEVEIDPERAALLDPSLPHNVIPGRAERETVTLAPPPSAGAAQPIQTAPAVAVEPAPARASVSTANAPADLDELIDMAAEIAVTVGHLTPQMVERKLRTGFDETGLILAALEERGVIAPASDDLSDQTRKARMTAEQLAAGDGPAEPEAPVEAAEEAREGYRSRTKPRARRRDRGRSGGQQPVSSGAPTLTKE